MPRPAPLSRLPRLLHPAAWWLWGLGLATAASRTTNPFLLLLVVAVAAWVVLERREVGATDVFSAFLVIGLVAIGLRVLTAGLLGGGVTGRVVLVRLPEVPLPAWTAGVRLGGPVTLEGLLAAAYDGLRLAAILACLGAAKALASPRRLLRYVPATLYDVGTAVVVALTYAPQMVQDAGRVRAARRLRGHSTRGLRSIARLAVPVMAGALDRSLELAASMESRGYGRAVHRTDASRRGASAMTVAGLLGILVGLYGLLDASTPPLLGLPLVLAGAVLAGLALLTGARRETRSRYRRDPWALPEWLVSLSGLLPGAVLVIATQRAWEGITPVQVPAGIPALPLPAVLAIGCAALAGVVAPVPPQRALLQAGAGRTS
jgi:energy-coupling factor transport system permease protein